MKIRTLNLRRIFSKRVFAAAAGIILLIAAILKAYDIELFMRQIKDYQIITGHLTLLISAWCLIITEFVLGTALIVYYRPKISVLLSIALFCIFIGATLWAWCTGVTEDCGCFGSWVKRSPSGAMIEDLLIVGVLLLAWPGRDYHTSRDPIIRPLIVIMSLIAGIILPIVYGTPVQELLGIEKGDGTSDKNLFSIQGLEDIDLKNGSFLFVLMGTDCLHCRDSIKDFNRIARKSNLPEVIALCPDEEDQIALFIEDLDPVFPVRKITEEDFYHLIGMGTTPFTLLVVKRQVLHTWNEEVPTVKSLSEAIGQE